MNPVIHLTNDLLTYSRLVGNARHLKATKTHGPAATAEERYYVKHARMEIAWCVLNKIVPYDQFRGGKFLHGADLGIQVHEIIDRYAWVPPENMTNPESRLVFVRQIDPANYEFCGWINARLGRRFGGEINTGSSCRICPDVLFPIQTLVESLRPQS